MNLIVYIQVCTKTSTVTLVVGLFSERYAGGWFIFRETMCWLVFFQRDYVVVGFLSERLCGGWFVCREIMWWLVCFQRDNVLLFLCVVFLFL